MTTRSPIHFLTCSPCRPLLFSSPAAPPAAPVPSALGMDAAKLAEIPKRMQAFVDDGTLAGAVTLVARHGQIASLEAVGRADVAGEKPMRPDSLFWIASMTKPITATAVPLPHHEGKLNGADPV